MLPVVSPTRCASPAQQLEAAGGDTSSYAKSTIVAATAPRKLGTLRDADGKEGF